MCQASFERAVLAANQFLKHCMWEKAQTTLQVAQRYGDELPSNTIIIADIQSRINAVKESVNNPAL